MGHAVSDIVSNQFQNTFDFKQANTKKKKNNNAKVQQERLKEKKGKNSEQRHILLFFLWQMYCCAWIQVCVFIGCREGDGK